MNKKLIHKILESVNKPSRYLGSEVNSVKKDPKSVKLKFALAFPDLYEIACSHFGIQILYSLLNEQVNVLAERVFAPGLDLEKRIKRSNIPLFSLENKIPLNEFDIIGFSLLTELNYTNVLNMLELSYIPLRAKDRDEKFPLIIAGGPCTCNPEPMADFFDAMVIGDGENVILEIVQCVSLSKSGKRSKATLYKNLKQIEGVYIPSIFENKNSKEYFNYPHSTKRGIVENLNDSFFPLKPIVPFSKPVHDRVRMEISRGCSRGCRFCQAGMLYRPVRERSPERVLHSITEILENTGYEDLSLLSLSTGDYFCLDTLLREIMARFSKNNISVSLPSFRAGTLNEATMKVIKKVRKTGFTIAPEAGSQKLRNVINKNLNERQILSTIDNAAKLGWKVIKLYFMIGLPSEDKSDLVEIVNLIKKIKSDKRKNLQININFAPFIPKPHTPFQWEPQQKTAIIREKLRFLKSALNMKGVKIKWQDPQLSQLEGLLSKGDRSFSNIIESAFQRGCKFDGWTDNFQYGKWESAALENNIEIETFNSIRRKFHDSLPWDHIDMRIRKDFLIIENIKAFRQETSEDCRFGKCTDCGSCSNNKYKPVVFKKFESISSIYMDDQKGIAKKAVLNFKKYSSARFFGHPEMANIIKRALRRAKVHIKHSEGFHPLPKISFDDPLPVGMESINEKIFLTFYSFNVLRPSEIVYRVNKELPHGLKIKSCLIFDNKWSKNSTETESYIVQSKDITFSKMNINHINSQLKSFCIKKASKKQYEKKYRLDKVIDRIKIIDERRLKLDIRNIENVKIRPLDILVAIKLCDSKIKDQYICYKLI